MHKFTNAELADLFFVYGLQQTVMDQLPYECIKKGTQTDHYTTKCSCMCIRSVSKLYISGERIQGTRWQRSTFTLFMEQALEAVDRNSITQASVLQHLQRKHVQRVLSAQCTPRSHIHFSCNASGNIGKRLPSTRGISLVVPVAKCSWRNYVLLKDEVSFPRESFLSIYNKRNWALENPHAMRLRDAQHSFNVNVWSGIVKDRFYLSYQADRMLGPT